MFSTIRSQLLACFLGVSFLVGGVSFLVGGQLLYRAFVNEATERVRMDLNTAREIYQGQAKAIDIAVSTTTLGTGFGEDLLARRPEALHARLKRLAEHAELDFAGVVDGEGRTICRLGSGVVLPGAEDEGNPVALLALERGRSVSGTAVVPAPALAAESPELARRAQVALVPTAMAAPSDAREVASGLVLASAVPVDSGGETVGVLYGGVLLNRSHSIVDKVRDTVFQGVSLNGRPLGTATIFLDDIRISTNVMDPAGRRAVGTRASAEVGRRVLADGRTWSDRAFVVDDWYITAYEPIDDVTGSRVGMLYVGILEARYASVQTKALLSLLVMTALGTILAFVAASYLAGRIMEPVSRLIKAASQVSQGDFGPDIGRIRRGEVGVLQRTFVRMLESLRDRDARIRAESDTRLIHYEKQASVGRLAAGVAHEINNPLTGVMTYTHMLLRRKDLDEEVRADLSTIATQTERVRRIVKGLLDFSRQTRLDREPTDVNVLVRSAVSLLENQALIRGVTLTLEEGEGVSTVTLDRSQTQSVVLNIIINAFDATSPGDTITVKTRTALSGGALEGEGVVIEVIDTGSGIQSEHLDKLFDPFFTTKEVGQGTGLGLAVSYGIVQRHGGLISVASEVDVGSTFTVWLPKDGGARDRSAEKATDENETHESVDR